MPSLRACLPIAEWSLRTVTVRLMTMRFKNSLSLIHINSCPVGYRLQYPEVELIHCTTFYLVTPLMLCPLILYVNGGTYSLTSTPNDRCFFLFENFFNGKLYLLSEFLKEIADVYLDNIHTFDPYIHRNDTRISRHSAGL